MTDVFETHDREQFEIYAYYCGIKRTDPTQSRIKASVDHWCEINGLSDQQAAKKIAEDQHRHPDRSQRLHQGCAHQGVRAAARAHQP